MLSWATDNGKRFRAISASPDPKRGHGNRVVRAGWLVLGLICVGLGIIGAILPLMPTTIFLILAAGCFARSSPRLEAWLLNHVHFGPTLRAWRANKAISLYAKIASCSGMAIGYALFLIGAWPGWPLAIGVAALMAGCAAYILSRPRPASPAVTNSPPQG